MMSPHAATGFLLSFHPAALLLVQELLYLPWRPATGRSPDPGKGGHAGSGEIFSSYIP
jgi:hypothetical protein